MLLTNMTRKRRLLRSATENDLLYKIQNGEKRQWTNSDRYTCTFQPESVSPTAIQTLQGPSNSPKHDLPRLQAFFRLRITGCIALLVDKTGPFVRLTPKSTEPLSPNPFQAAARRPPDEPGSLRRQPAAIEILLAGEDLEWPGQVLGRQITRLGEEERRRWWTSPVALATETCYMLRWRRLSSVDWNQVHSALHLWLHNALWDKSCVCFQPSMGIVARFTADESSSLLTSSSLSHWSSLLCEP